MFKKEIHYFGGICPFINISYTATTVLPADVWADTSTDWLFSKHNNASFWKGSRMKGYSFAGLAVVDFNASNTASGGIATYNARQVKFKTNTVLRSKDREAIMLTICYNQLIWMLIERCNMEYVQYMTLK